MVGRQTTQGRIWRLRLTASARNSSRFMGSRWRSAGRFGHRTPNTMFSSASVSRVHSGPARIRSAEASRSRRTCSLSSVSSEKSVILHWIPESTCLSSTRRFPEWSLSGTSTSDAEARALIRRLFAVRSCGMFIGTAAAWLLARALASLQYGVSTTDPLSWSVGLGVIALVTIGASWRPAQLAVRTDPVVLLKDE